jgi:hypothetical protein
MASITFDGKGHVFDIELRTGLSGENKQITGAFCLFDLIESDKVSYSCRTDDLECALPLVKRFFDADEKTLPLIVRVKGKYSDNNYSRGEVQVESIDVLEAENDE